MSRSEITIGNAFHRRHCLTFDRKDPYIFTFAFADELLKQKFLRVIKMEAQGIIIKDVSDQKDLLTAIAFQAFCHKWCIKLSG